jgi:hypothetical protein
MDGVHSVEKFSKFATEMGDRCRYYLGACANQAGQENEEWLSTLLCPLGKPCNGQQSRAIFLNNDGVTLLFMHSSKFDDPSTTGRVAVIWFNKNKES